MTIGLLSKKPPRTTFAQLEAIEAEADRSEEHNRLAGELAVVEQRHREALPPVMAAEATAKEQWDRAAAAARKAEDEWRAALLARRNLVSRYDTAAGNLSERLLATVSPKLSAEIERLTGELDKARRHPTRSQTIFRVKPQGDPFAHSARAEATNVPAIRLRVQAVKAALERLESSRLVSDPSETMLAEVLATIPAPETANEIEPPPEGWR